MILLSRVSSIPSLCANCLVNSLAKDLQFNVCVHISAAYPLSALLRSDDKHIFCTFLRSGSSWQPPPPTLSLLVSVWRPEVVVGIVPWASRKTVEDNAHNFLLVEAIGTLLGHFARSRKSLHDNQSPVTGCTNQFRIGERMNGGASISIMSKDALAHAINSDHPRWQTVQPGCYSTILLLLHSDCRAL